MRPNQPTPNDLQDRLHDTLAEMPGVDAATAHRAAYGCDAPEAW